MIIHPPSNHQIDVHPIGLVLSTFLPDQESIIHRLIQIPIPPDGICTAHSLDRARLRDGTFSCKVRMSNFSRPRFREGRGRAGQGCQIVRCMSRSVSTYADGGVQAFWTRRSSPAERAWNGRRRSGGVWSLPTYRGSMAADGRVVD